MSIMKLSVDWFITSEFYLSDGLLILITCFNGGLRNAFPDSVIKHSVSEFNLLTHRPVNSIAKLLHLLGMQK